MFKYLQSIPNELTLWRGQANSEWFITSSFFRNYDKNGGLLLNSIEDIEKGKDYNLEDEYFNKAIKDIEEFQKELLKYNLRFSYKQVLYLAQHYGLETNLIDFTYNPYIALFFAFDYEKKPDSGYVSVYRTAPFKFYKIMEYGIKRTYFVCVQDIYEEFITLKKDDKNLKVPLIEFNDIWMNMRIKNQQGAFVYFPYNYPYDAIMYRIKVSDPNLHIQSEKKDRY